MMRVLSFDYVDQPFESVASLIRTPVLLDFDNTDEFHPRYKSVRFDKPESVLTNSLRHPMAVL